MVPSKTVGVVGFEPAIQGPLESLLSSEPHLSVVRFPHNWSPGVSAAFVTEPIHFLILSPPTPEWVDRIHAQFPSACLLAMVEWHRREQFRLAPIQDYFERFQSYQGVLELLRKHYQD
ncbi:hypothetical protein IV102_12750 [bacterium]|nr:hypothetical protein [bacterium]